MKYVNYYGFVYPTDYQNPVWSEVDTERTWKTFIGPLIRKMWGDFTDLQKAALANQAEEKAMRTEWSLRPIEYT